MREIILNSKIKVDDIVEQASNIFDYEFKGITEIKINIPDIPKEYQIGLIVGSSGSGKTKILEQKGFGTRSKIQAIHANRICFSHEYLG